MVLGEMLGFLMKPKYFILLLIIAFIPIVHYGINAVQTDSDEYTYYYMGYVISKGYIPYKDFFCAHMPLMIYPIGLLYFLFEPSITLGKLVSLVSFFFVSFLTYLIGERYKKSAGILACALLLLSVMPHAYARSMYGLHLCLGLGLASFYFHLTGRKLLSGFFIVLSMFVRLNIYPLLLFLILLNKRNKRFYYGLAAAAPLLLFVFTPNFIDNAILYHLERTIYGPATKISMLNQFIVSEWLLVSLSIVGVLVLYFNRKWKNLGELYGRITTNDVYEEGLVLFIVLFFLLTLAQRSLINYYFIFMLPFMAVVGSLGVLNSGDLDKNKVRLLLIPPLGLYLYYATPGAVYVAAALGLSYFTKKQKVFFFMSGVMLAAIYFNHNSISMVYPSIKIKSFDELSDYVAKNTSRGEKIAYIGYGNAYVALKSDRMLAGNFIDITDQMFFIYADRVDEMLLGALRDDVGLAVLELRHTYYLSDRGVNFSKTMDYLRENFMPVEFFYDWGDLEQRRLLVVWSPLPRVNVGNQVFRRPLANGTRYFFERYYFFVGGMPQMQEKVDVRFMDVSQPYIPEALHGGNIYNLTLVPENVFLWPLREGDHYEIRTGELASDVWVSSIRDGRIRFMVDTHVMGKTVAFSEIVYNYTGRQVEYIASFSRLSDFVVNGFIPSYQQIPLSEVEYERLDYIKKQFEAKNITEDEYQLLRTGILPETETNKTLSLNKK